MDQPLLDSPGKTLLLDREPPEPPRLRRKEAIAAQLERTQVLIAQGFIVTGGPSQTAEGRILVGSPGGVTVFHNGYRRPLEIRGGDWVKPEAAPPELTPAQVKRRVSRWLENHPGETPRDETATTTDLAMDNSINPFVDFIEKNI